MAKRRPSRHDKVLPPVNPNAGITACYRARLDRLIDEMHRSIEHWVIAAYRQNEPVMAQDELPATALRRAMRALARRWQARFDVAARELAAYFGRSVSRRSDAALRTILKKAGITVKFTMTRAQRDIIRASINENVSLIRSIPQQYLGQVEGMVYRSVTAGRDAGTLAKELQSAYGVTKRRAALIARDQNNKATSALVRARQVEMGVTQAIWRHSHAGRKKRPTHVANDGGIYDPAIGWFDPDPRVRRYIHPGELINCRCRSRSIIPGIARP